MLIMFQNLEFCLYTCNLFSHFGASASPDTSDIPDTPDTSNAPDTSHTAGFQREC